MAHPYEQKTIFSFWEPQGAMTPYLNLCKRTWERYLPKYDIIFLDYSNLADYLPENTFDIEALKRVQLMLQKDAVMVGVLKEHGGIFMDADTMVLKDISPIIAMLDETEMVMFNTHLAFVAARPGSYILELWLKGIQGKIRDLNDRRKGGEELNWDFLGNSVLDEVMDEMISSAGYMGKLQRWVLDEGILAMQPEIKDRVLNLSALKTMIYKLCNSLRNKKREILFHAMFRNHLTMLDRLEYGFIPEANYFKTKRMTPEQKYENFWFKNDRQIQDVFLNNQMIIGLHNSWTPQWYKDLSDKDVLENDCLLSRTLKCLLKS